MAKICSTNYERICPVYQDIQDYLSFFVSPRRVPVSVIVPTYIPPAIKYKFEGRPEVIVNRGVRYELDEEDGEYGLGNYVVTLNVTRELQNAAGTVVIGSVIDRWTISVSNVKWVGVVPTTNPNTGGFGGICLPWRGFGYSIITATGTPITYRFNIAPVPPSGTMTCVGGGSHPVGRNIWRGISNLVVTQTAGQPPDTRCTIRVYDKNNNLLVTDIGDDCPDVDNITEACFYESKNEMPFAAVFEGTDTIYYNIRSNTQNNRKCTFITSSVLQLDIGSSPSLKLDYIESGAIYSICSEEGCELAPLMCFVCPPPPDEECEECPEGTTTTILDGSNLLCVDSQGCVIATIPYDPECHKPDCFC